MTWPPSHLVSVPRAVFSVPARPSGAPHPPPPGGRRLCQPASQEAGFLLGTAFQPGNHRQVLTRPPLPCEGESPRPQTQQGGLVRGPGALSVLRWRVPTSPSRTGELRLTRTVAATLLWGA